MNNEDQIEYWNGEVGQRWTQYNTKMECLLQPVTEALLAHAPLDGCTSAIDIGCGCANQTLTLAERLGANASVLGVDISAPMLELAREQAARPADNRAGIDILQADAAEHKFEKSRFDLLFSRFGVMFFADPVAAFSNLRQALQTDARLLFCCWQAVKDNDWVRIPMEAALTLLPPPEPADPQAPGPFAFADPDRVRKILADSGFGDIAVNSFTPTLRFAETSTIEQSVNWICEMGPLGRLMTGVDQTVKDSVSEKLCGVLAPYYHEGVMMLPAAIWFVTARCDS